MSDGEFRLLSDQCEQACGGGGARFPGDALAWLGGARARVLRLCPGERSLYAGLGLGVLLTALFGGMSAAFALSYVLHVPVGVLWPVVMFWALTLVRLAEAGIDFPMIYIAHEVPKGRLAIPGGAGPASQPATIDRTAADAAVGPVPPPAATTALADQLGRGSQRVLQALATAVPVAGAIVAAPFLLAGAAVAAVGALVLDPIVFGVIPAGSPVPGQLGAWFVLAQWDWPAIPAPPR